jgi:hypothetical protein
MKTPGHYNGRLQMIDFTATFFFFFSGSMTALDLSELSPERSFGSCQTLHLRKKKTSLCGVSINK